MAGFGRRHGGGPGINKVNSNLRTQSMMGTIGLYGESQVQEREVKDFKDAANYVKEAIGLKKGLRHAKSDIKLLHVEEARYHEPGEFLLHPMGEFRSRWDQVTAVLIVWMCFYVPFKIGEL